MERVSRNIVTNLLKMLAEQYNVPTPKWRFAHPGEELRDWYDVDNKTIVIDSESFGIESDLSNIRHEFIHYACDMICKDPLRCGHAEDVAERFMDSPIECGIVRFRERSG